MTFDKTRFAQMLVGMIFLMFTPFVAFGTAEWVISNFGRDGLLVAGVVLVVLMAFLWAVDFKKASDG